MTKSIGGSGENELFNVLFMTTPNRMGTPRFPAYFARAQLDSFHLRLVLKRREPSRIMGEGGQWKMGWGPSCSELEFEQAARMLRVRAHSAWINAEGGLRDLDEKLALELPGLGVLLSGHELDPDQTEKSLAALPAATPVMLALESEAMMLAGPRLLSVRPLAGLVIGSSYLSESSKMYDQMGLAKYRSLLRGLAKRAEAVGCRPYTSSNYCTFETTGVGDKSKDFVFEQMEFVSRHTGWGIITRFYSHLDVGHRALEKIGYFATGGKAATWKI